MDKTGSQGADLNSMSLEDLKRLQRDVAKAVAGYDAKQRQEARAEVDALLHKRGLTLADIVDLGTKGTKAIRSPVAPKYRHPENAAITWSGRGRRPGWIKEAQAKGQSFDDFLIR